MPIQRVDIEQHQMFWICVGDTFKITTTCPADGQHREFLRRLELRLINEFVNTNYATICQVYEGDARDYLALKMNAQSLGSTLKAKIQEYLKNYHRDYDNIRCAYCGYIKILHACGFCKQCDNNRSINCPACEEHKHEFCRYCHNCRDCCDCITCEDCGGITDDVCEEESFCRACCRCSRMSEINFDTQAIYDADRLEKHKFKCVRHVGIEWEFNDCDKGPIEKWAKKWDATVHHDGSCGWEAVTAPLAGDFIAECLSHLGTAFDEGDAKFNSQCGLHVHVSATDLNWEQMYNLLWVYAKVEPLLYIIGGYERSVNEYCSHIGEQYKDALVNTRGFPGDYDQEKDRKISILSLASKRKVIRGYHDPRFIKKDSGRYRGLNICPWIAGRAKRKQETAIQRIMAGKIGQCELITGRGVPGTREHKIVGVNPDTTVEFRIHQHTDSADEVINWAQICALIVDWSSKASRKEVLALPKSALRALCQIAPMHKQFILKHIKEWRRKCLPRTRKNYISTIGEWQCVASLDSSE